jgi:hypothetical protein
VIALFVLLAGIGQGFCSSLPDIINMTHGDQSASNAYFLWPIGTFSCFLMERGSTGSIRNGYPNF